MGHTSSPSIVGQFSISCQFRLVNALEVRFKSIKKLPSISETQRSFTAFSTFRKATKVTARDRDFYSVFDHDEGLNFRVRKA